MIHFVPNKSLISKNVELVALILRSLDFLSCHPHDSFIAYQNRSGYTATLYASFSFLPTSNPVIFLLVSLVLIRYCRSTRANIHREIRSTYLQRPFTDDDDDDDDRLTFRDITRVPAYKRKSMAAYAFVSDYERIHWTYVVEIYDPATS